MVKNLITVGAAAAIMMLSAIPSFAHTKPKPTPMPTVTNNGNVSSNAVVAVANTGVNGQTGGKNQTIVTGAAGAQATQVNVVNSGCPCGNAGTTTNNGTVTDNYVVAVANTGINGQTTSGQSGHHSGSSQVISTGAAGAIAGQFNVVNSSVSP